MRKFASVFLAGLFFAPVVNAGEVTVEGTLIDTRCYSFNQVNTTDDHDMGGKVVKGCAAACAKMGIPVALLEGGQAGSKMFVLASPAPLLAEHMGKTARLTGNEISPGTVLPKKLEVQGDGGEWQEVKTTGMM